VLHIGIDEAGYGPLLGPLVIAAAVYTAGGSRGSLPGRGIDDSKRVYSRGGRRALARVLGPYFGAKSGLGLADLLVRHGVRPDPRPEYPWYTEVHDPLPGSGPVPAAFQRIWLNSVCARDFNRGCARLGSKAALLFEETMRVLRRALEERPGETAEVVCDKHGGRNHYAPLLMAEFGPRDLAVEREGREESSYRFDLDGRKVSIRFLKGADGKDRPAALASMAAKYVRELFMEALNRFFARRVAGLSPTAGYVADGRRFLAEVEGVLRELGCSRDAFVRSR